MNGIKIYRVYNLKKILGIFFMLTSICIFLVSLVSITKWYFHSKENEEIIYELTNDAISKTANVDSSISSIEKIDFESLKSKNKDTVAWIKVNGTKINYPVVQTTDNVYYLNHNFNHNYNVAGWIFLDYRNNLDKTDKNIIIYGHNMLDDSMFGTLLDTLKNKWLENNNNHTVTFTTENETSIYEVFSVYKIKSERYYIKTDFNDGEFFKFVKKLKQRSIYNFKIDVNENDQILTLSTCANNLKDRVVLHAKKVVE